MNIEKITRKLIDEGKIIEAGWISFRIISIPDGASQRQLDDMRAAFFAGAQHLFGSIMVSFDPGKEPTDNDLRRMSQINMELNEFIAEFKKKHAL